MCSVLAYTRYDTAKQTLTHSERTRQYSIIDNGRLRVPCSLEYLLSCSFQLYGVELAKERRQKYKV